MALNPQDQEIVKLLTKLKTVEGQYPEHMLVARRQRFLRQMAEIGMGISGGTALEEAAKSANAPAASSAASSATSTFLETVLVVAIIVETGAVAYFYRDKIVDFFQSNPSESRVQEVVTPPPVATTPLEILGATPSPAVTATAPIATLSASPTNIVVTVSSTPIPGVAEENSNTVNSSTTAGSSQVEIDSTPVPNENNSNDNGNQGNHYGQTPKPERTKENSGDSNPAPQNDDTSSSQSNNEQPPQDTDTKPPKPTKTK